MNLNGKIAVVTGGGRGIGKAVSQQLAQLGAKVYINYVSRPDAAQQTVDGIVAAGGAGSIIQFDVSNFDEVQASFKEIIKQEDTIDILVNNAGITKDGLLARMKEDDWDAVLTTNLKGAFNCIKAVTRPMMKQKSGRIVNISSVIGFAGNAGQVNYSSAKAGLTGLTKSVARELATRNITVNGVAPGYIETDMTNGLSAEVTDVILKEIPMAKLGLPTDVSAAVAFLVSDAAHYITGQFIHVNGGMYM